MNRCLFCCGVSKKLQPAFHVHLKHLLLIIVWGISATACGNESRMPENHPDAVGERAEFAKGADVSWLTEMEAAGIKFYDASGKQTECMALLRNLGFNAIRLRVWVNPANGWCNKDDVLVKASRAQSLGMRIMLDFHYSDVWADPASQYKPVAWEDLSLDELLSALSAHTKEVLDALLANHIVPEWVQIGNEVGPGMLWDTDGTVSGATYDVKKEGGLVYAKNEANFALFITTGCKAAKQVFPDAKVIVHLQEGNNNDLFRWIFDMLTAYGAEYDVIGMSLYPEADTWADMTAACLNNMKDMMTRYGKEVMLCEVGMHWDEAEACNRFLTNLLAQSRMLEHCLGVFYWEPEAYGGWNGYTKGAFDEEGKPTVALDAFKP